MEILAIFLYDNRYLQDFLDALVEEGIEDVMIVEAQEIKSFLAFKMPLFKELQTTLGGQKREPKLIFALVEKEKIKRMLSSWREDLEIDKEEIATIFSLPLKLLQKAPHFY